MGEPMNIEIFTQGSETTAEETDQCYIDYFRGSFTRVQSLREELSKYGDVDVHIVDDAYGYVSGDMNVGDKVAEKESAVPRFRESLLERAETADVILLMLTKDLLTEIVVPNWEEITEKAQNDSVWCLSCPRSVLDELDLDTLEDKATILVYRRKGVARLGQEIEAQLLEKLDAE
jgi:hypothetical protein